MFLGTIKLITWQPISFYNLSGHLTEGHKRELLQHKAGCGKAGQCRQGCGPARRRGALPALCTVRVLFQAFIMSLLLSPIIKVSSCPDSCKLSVDRIALSPNKGRMRGQEQREERSERDLQTSPQCHSSGEMGGLSGGFAGRGGQRRRLEGLGRAAAELEDALATRLS